MIFKFISNGSSLFLKLVNLHLTFTWFKFFSCKILLRTIQVWQNTSMQYHFFLSLRSFAKKLSFLEKNLYLYQKPLATSLCSFLLITIELLCAVSIYQSPPRYHYKALRTNEFVKHAFYFVHSFNSQMRSVGEYSIFWQLSVVDVLHNELCIYNLTVLNK